MLTFVLMGVVLLMMVVCFLLVVWVTVLSGQNDDLKREVKAITMIADSIMSGKSTTPNPFPTNQRSKNE